MASVGAGLRAEGARGVAVADARNDHRGPERVGAELQERGMQRVLRADPEALAAADAQPGEAFLVGHPGGAQEEPVGPHGEDAFLAADCAEREHPDDRSRKNASSDGSQQTAAG